MSTFDAGSVTRVRLGSWRQTGLKVGLAAAAGVKETEDERKPDDRSGSTDAIAAGEIDTVIVAFADAQGRLVGKRVSARFFQDVVLPHGAEACNYLLSVDVDMNTVDGYAMSSWDTGYGDMMLLPDPATLRRIPWLPGTALVMADLAWESGDPVVQSPRDILNRQRAPPRRPRTHRLLRHRARVHRLRRHLSGCLGPGLSRTHAVDRLQRRLRPARLGPTRAAAARHPASMDGAGLYCEGVKGECNFGQQEIAFRYAEVLETADQHAIYKNGAKAIAGNHGKSLTFMAKFNEREGNSCHIHLSVRDESGAPVMAGDGAHGFSPLMGSWIAGILATLREFTLLYAPTINSYKRFAKGSFAPTGIAWGLDNRTCALRVIGHGSSLRVENRVPGGDVNPYLGIAGDHRGRTARHRERAAAARSAVRKRLHLGCRPASDDAARGGAAVQRVGDRARRVRRRDGRPLSQPGAHRGRGLRRRRDGLGAGAWLRTTLNAPNRPSVARSSA